MSDHKYKLGQGLQFIPRRTSSRMGANTCKVTMLLPANAREPQYRIKCSNENFERVVCESELN
jgi:hypothetical protein